MEVNIEQNRKGVTHNQAWGIDESPTQGDDTGNQNPKGCPVDTSAMRRVYDSEEAACG